MWKDDEDEDYEYEEVVTTRNIDREDGRSTMVVFLEEE